MRTATLLLATFLITALSTGCDDKKDTTAKADAKGKGDAKSKDGAKTKPELKKADAKGDTKADAKGDAKADAKADGPEERVPTGKADDDASKKALEEFEKSREAKVSEVTAKPGTPEWFVQGLEAFRAGNIDPIVANFANDIRWDAVGSPLEGPSEGKAAVMSRWEDLLIGIPDMKLHATRIFHHGNLVVMQVVLTGTHKGNFRGLPPTDKPVGTEVLTWIWHDAEGKAKNVRVVYDEATLLAQMGKLEGAEVPPIPAVPTAAPEIVGGEDDAASIAIAKKMYAAGKGSWKLCETKLCTATYAHHEARTGKTIDKPADHAAAHDMFVAAFPDLSTPVEDVVSFGAGWVVVYAHAKGTHKGDLGGLKATKKKIDLSYSEVMRIDGGKIAEAWGYSNGLELLAELGVFTAPAQAPADADKPAEATADAKADSKADAKADAKTK